MPIGTAQQIIELRASQYIGDARVPDFIALSTQLTGAVFGDDKQLAIALRALHMLALADRGSSVTGTAGAITQEKEGQLSRSYGASAQNDQRFPDLSQTSWGRELLALQNMSIMGYRDKLI